MTLSLRGLGEYPGYYCYDTNRPTILPYWIDSWTESTCKWRPSTIAGNIASCAAGAGDCGDPVNPNPKVSGPGTGGPPLSAGNSTAAVEPVETLDIPTAIGQTIGTTVHGATVGVASGLTAGLGDLALPLLLIGGLLLLSVLKK